MAADTADYTHEALYLKGAVAAMQKAAKAIDEHPELDPATLLRDSADWILLEYPGAFS